MTNKKRYIATFTRPINPKPIRMMTQDERTSPTNHVTHQRRSHVRNQKRYISTFTRPMDLKLSQLVTQDEGTPTTKSRDTSISWSRDKQKTFYFHFHKAYGPQTQDQGPHLPSHVTHRLRGHVTNQKRCISISTGPLDPKLSWVVFQMRVPNPQCHVTLQHCGYLTNKKRYISPFI